MKIKLLLYTSMSAAMCLFHISAYADIVIYQQDNTKLTFGGSLVAAGFLNQDSWFGQSKSFLGKNTDRWGEFGFAPEIAFETSTASSKFFGKLGYIYTNTVGDDASGLTIGQDHTSYFHINQGYIGWEKSNILYNHEDSALSISIGRQNYSIGSGLLIADGSGDGGARGGWYLGMRKSFKNSVIVRLNSKDILAEVFHLRNHPRGDGVEGTIDGANLEYHVDEKLTIGGSYMVGDGRTQAVDKLDVYSARLNFKPINDITLSGEYVYQISDQINANGGYVQAAYAFDDMPWSPTFSYRYARFDEKWQPFAYGFTDYGTWYQGEITGNYPLGNSNLISHLLKVQLHPIEKVTVNLLYYKFSLIAPSTLAETVTSHDWGDEINFIADWQATETLNLSGVAGVLFPGHAAKEWVNGDDNWLSFMLYASYSF